MFITVTQRSKTKCSINVRWIATISAAESTREYRTVITLDSQNYTTCIETHEQVMALIEEAMAKERENALRG